MNNRRFSVMLTLEGVALFSPLVCANLKSNPCSLRVMVISQYVLVQLIWLSVKAGMGNQGTEWGECRKWEWECGNGVGNAGNLGGNAGNAGNAGNEVGMRRIMVGNTRNQSGNAGNLGGNVRNQNANVGNRVEIEKTKWKFIKSNFLFAEIGKKRN